MSLLCSKTSPHNEESQYFHNGLKGPVLLSDLIFYFPPCLLWGNHADSFLFLKHGPTLGALCCYFPKISRKISTSFLHVQYHLIWILSLNILCKTVTTLNTHIPQTLFSSPIYFFNALKYWHMTYSVFVCSVPTLLPN